MEGTGETDRIPPSLFQAMRGRRARPVRARAPPPTFSGPRKLGNTLPIKRELVDANGNPIGDLSTLKSAQACSTTGGTVPPASSAKCVVIYSSPTITEGSTTFRFSSPNFIINWDTGSKSDLSTGYWTIVLQLSDGSIEWPSSILVNRRGPATS
jgi:hypothetical protein